MVTLAETLHGHSSSITIANWDVFKVRKCFKCKSKLHVSAAWQSKIYRMTLEQFYKIWQSEYVQFYCCKCYNTNKEAMLGV
jgi:hypothetical protein